MYPSQTKPFKGATSNRIITIKMRMLGGAKSTQEKSMYSEANEGKWCQPEDRLNEDMEDHPEVAKPVDN